MTTGEIYECCVSDAAGAVCTTFGLINAVVVVLIVIWTIMLNLWSEWYRYNLLFNFATIYQLLPAIWRAIFYLEAGFPGDSGSGWYRTFRSSDSGDFVVSLVGFAMYLYLLPERYTAEASYSGERENYHTLRNQLAFGFWAFFGVYSIWWYFFFVKTRDTFDMAWVDFATSIWFAALIPVYHYLGNRLIKSSNAMLGYGEREMNAPGVAKIVSIIKLQTIAMFIRTFETSLQDIQKLGDYELISKTSSHWPALMAVQCMTQLFACFVFFYSIILINLAEGEIWYAMDFVALPSNANLKVQVCDLEGSDLIVVQLKDL